MKKGIQWSHFYLSGVPEREITENKAKAIFNEING